MNDAYRLTLTTYSIAPDNERYLYSFTEVYDPERDQPLEQLVFRLCLRMAEAMIKNNHLFGHTIGPMRVETEDAGDWPRRTRPTPISSSSSTVVWVSRDPQGHDSHPGD